MESIFSHKIKSTSSVVGSWYRVTGTPSKPVFDKLVLWAVLDVIEKNDSNGIGWSGEFIAGIPLSGIGTTGVETEHLIQNVAGYIECDSAKIASLKSNPSLLLSDYDDEICWDEVNDH